jgi:hypothetical protein
MALLSAAIFLAKPAYGMKKQFGRVADPATGAAMPGANVLVLGAGTEKQAVIFKDSAGQAQLKNPVQADATGRYSFYAPNGRYRLKISSAAGNLVYDLDDLPIFDPREPQTIVATEKHPALSLHTLGKMADVNLPLVMERCNEKGDLFGAAWRVLCQFTEKGWVLSYNYRRRGGASRPSDRCDELAFKDMQQVDSPKEPSFADAFGTNDADDGILGWPGLTIFGGGAWAGESHLTRMNVQLTMPRGKSVAGIAVRMDGPEGLSIGDVVALDTADRSRVAPIKARGAKLPFVVARADEAGVFVLVRGLAWVKVDGPVDSGDILVASAVPGRAMADNTNSDPSYSIGIAVIKATQGWTLVRIQRVADSIGQR